MLPREEGSSMFSAVERPCPTRGGALYVILVFMILL